MAGMLRSVQTVIRLSDHMMLCSNKRHNQSQQLNIKDIKCYGLLASVYPSRLTEATLLLRDNLPGFLCTLDMLCV